MVHRACLALLFMFALTTSVFAQSNPEKSNPRSKATKAKATKSEESDPVYEQRRIVAIELLTALADDARSFRDQALRARVEARAGDAFWETDVEKARALFHRAWEEAEAADAETARKQAEDLRRQLQAGGSVIIQRPRDVRSEVLRLVAKRDAKLGEAFLQKLAEADAQASKEAAEPFADPLASSVAMSKRIQLARRLLEDGDLERAMQFAAPALNSVTREAINFLCALREKNASAADQGFLSLLTRVEMDPGSDANTISGLSSYAFTPFFFVVFSKDGGANISAERRDVPAPDLPASVRNSFFRVAAQVLLRPLAPPDQDQTTSGRVGKFMVIKRLLPLFEQYASEPAQLLKTVAAALSGDVPEDMRTGPNNAITRGIVPEDTSRNELERMQERLDRARTSAERDVIYADYATSLAGKGDPRARDLVDKIADSEFRKSVRGYIDFQAAQQAINNKDAAEAASVAKNGELTSPQRIWTYTRAARLLIKSDQTRAMELLEEAAAEARRVSGSSPDKAKGLIGVAGVMLQADRVRAWEIVSEAMKAANASEGFTGEDSSVAATLRSPQLVLVSRSSAEEFDLLGLFRSLAKDDLNRSVQLAKSFTGESPRAVATLSIARSVLEKNAGDSAFQ